MAPVIRPAAWPLHETGIASLDASYATSRVYRVLRGPLSFQLSVEEVDPPLRRAVPVGAYLAELRAAQHVVVADDEGTVVGVAAANQEQWNRRVRVDHFYVAPTARRRGVGRALMDSVVAFARAQDTWCVWLETQATNFGAVQFYQRVGFRLCGLDERLYDPASPVGADTALFLALELTPSAG